jgi:hypothetical protein
MRTLLTATAVLGAWPGPPWMLEGFALYEVRDQRAMKPCAKNWQWI